MALAAATIFDVRSGGSDTANGGCFDPSQTAGMFTDGAATSATGNTPSFTSASYTFVSGDENAYLYMANGTNVTKGWYRIASVSAGAAILAAAVGEAYLMVNNTPAALNTVAGCATTGSPTGITWTIDYSQQDTVRQAYTDLASAGTGLTISSAANPFGRQMVGNGLQTTSGTNINAGVYVIASVAAGTFIATVVGAGNITTGAGASGVGGMGGAFATLGKAAGFMVAGNDAFYKAGTYAMTTSSSNVAGGRVAHTVGGTGTSDPAYFCGWDTERTITNQTTTRPIHDAGAQTSLTMLSFTGAYTKVRNIDVDGNGNSSITGIVHESIISGMSHCHAANTTVIGIDARGGNCNSYCFLSSTGHSGTVGIRIGAANYACAYGCEAWGGTTTGISLGGSSSISFSISSGNSGGSSLGFKADSLGYMANNCTAYGNGSHGFDCDNSTANTTLIDCISEGNGGWGYYASGVRSLVRLWRCAGYNNTSGNYNAANITDVVEFKAGSGSFFTNAASGDFSLNNTAGAGAILRAAGYPGTFPRGTTTAYQDIGAAQHQDSGGGGSGRLVGTGTGLVA